MGISFGGNQARLFEAIRVFRIEFGDWPTKAIVGKDIYETLERDHFDAEALALLHKRLLINVSLDPNALSMANDNGAILQYGDMTQDRDRAESVTQEDVMAWFVG